MERRPASVEYFNLRTLLALCVVAVACLAMPHLLETYLILDGHIDNPGRVYAAQAALAAVGVAAAIWSGGRRTSRLPRRALLLGSLAFALSSLFAAGMVEVALHVKPGLALDAETFGEFQFRQRQGVSHAAYTFDAYDPELGWVPAPNYDDAHGVRTNAHGIRANREFAAHAPPGLRRIVLLGDSFTWGEPTGHAPIRNEETFAAVLESRLAKVETINLGVHGWGTDQQLLYLRRLGLKLTPDLVVLCFLELDYERNGVSFYSYAKPRFVLEEGGLRLVGTPVPEREEFLARPFRLPTFLLPAFLDKSVNAVLDQTKLRPFEQRESWRVTEAIFDAFKRDTEAAGARFLLVDVPPSMRQHPSAIEQAATHWAERTATQFLSLRAAFVRLPAAESAQLYDGHFTVQGHRATATALADHVTRQRLLHE